MKLWHLKLFSPDNELFSPEFSRKNYSNGYNWNNVKVGGILFA